MARVSIELPDQYSFTTQIDVGIGFINYGGHLGNDSALTLLHEARMRYVRSLGYTELNIEGFGLIQADAAIRYKSQAFWGDTLFVDLAVAELNRNSFDLVYRVRKQGSEVDVLQAKTGMVFFDYSLNKPTRIPTAFLAAVERGQPPAQTGDTL